MRPITGDPKKDKVVSRMIASGNWKLGPNGELLRVNTEEANQAALQQSREAANTAKYSPTTVGFMTPERKQYLETLDRPLTSQEARERATVSFDPSEGPNMLFAAVAGEAPMEPVALLAGQAIKRLGRGLANKTKFVSEIDWSKWNPETPKYPELIKEYNEIEKRTKRAGTWMRNADGTDFVGSPEQFIQQQSYYYRKAFPDGGTRTYRGVGPGEYKTGNTPRWDDSGYDPAKAIPSNRPVFVSEDFEQALGYAGGESNPTEFLRFQNSRDPRGGTFNLQAPSGMTDLASDQSGRNFSDLGSTPGTGPFKARGIRNVSSKEELNKFYSDYNDWARKNKKASITSAEARKQFKDAPKFNSLKQEQAWIKANIQQASTDDVAEFMASTEGKKYSSFTARDIDDSGMGDVRIHQNIPGNYLKSNIGNVGFFDLSDPDVFKALVPIVGTSAAIKLAKSQGVENPGQEMSKGGSIAMKKRPTGMSTIRK